MKSTWIVSISCFIISTRLVLKQYYIVWNSGDRHIVLGSAQLATKSMTSVYLPDWKLEPELQRTKSKEPGTLVVTIADTINIESNVS